MGASEESMERPLLAERGISSPPSAPPKSSSTDSLTGVVVASTFVAVLGSYEFGSSIGFSSPAQSGIMADLGLSLAQYSVFGSIVTLGAMLGAIMSGRIADFMGRRGVMGISDIFCIAGWITIFCSKGFWGLILGRLSVGFGIGLLSYVVPVYIAEITSKNLRGGFITMHQFMICCGSSIAFVMGTFLPWRTLALLGATPCLLQSVGLFFIPESPRWLAKIDHYEEFESALQSLRGKNVDISLEADEIMECTRSLQLLPKARILDLFQRRYLHSVIVGVGIMVLQQFSGVNGVIYYASALFVLSGFSSGYIGSIAMAAVQIPMTALGVLLIDKTGRRPLLMVSAAGTCLGCILVGISFLLQENEWWKALTPVLTLTGILVYTGSFSFAMAGIPWVIMSEIFPMNMKGSAGSLVALVNWFGTGIISYVFNFLISWSAVGTFFIFAGFCGITILFVVKLVPETKGKTLEEIQDSMMLFSLE